MGADDLDMSIEAMHGAVVAHQEAERCSTDTTSGGALSTSGQSGTGSWTPSRRAQSGGGRPSRYLTADGRTVPGVTSVLAMLAKGDALLGWAAKLAREGKDWREERDRAAELGTDIHHAILERLLVGEDEDEVLRDLDAKWGKRGTHAVSEYLRWESKRRPAVSFVEVPLVSTIHSVGGCLDLPCVIDGRVTYVDLKTSPRAYGSMAVQCAAYDILWRERHGYGFDAFSILCLPKDGKSTYAEWTWTDLGPAREVFLHARQLYALMPHVEKLVA